MPNLYRDFKNQQELDAEYDIERLTPTFLDHIGRYQEASQRALSTLEVTTDIPYGPTIDEHLDFFPAKSARPPLLVFIHGGYWRFLSSKDTAFAALGPVEAGFSVANINYSLCPTVSIDEIVRQARASIAWLWHNAESLGFDRDRIYISGHSAGAHLSAMCMLADWPGTYGIPADVIKGALLVSGVFDLRPLQFTFVQPALQLNPDLAVRNSPILNASKVSAKTIVAFGEHETHEFQRQSIDFGKRWQAEGNDTEQVLRLNTDHFSIMFDFERGDSQLIRDLSGML